MLDLLGSGDELAEPPPGITHQQPPTIDVDRDKLNDQLGYDVYELQHERGLVTLDRCVRLEPRDAARGGYPKDGRPRVEVRLLDRLDHRAGDMHANPRVSILEPVGVAPVHSRNPIPLADLRRQVALVTPSAILRACAAKPSRSAVKAPYAYGVLACSA